MIPNLARMCFRWRTSPPAYPPRSLLAQTPVAGLLSGRALRPMEVGPTTALASSTASSVALHERTAEKNCRDRRASLLRLRRISSAPVPRPTTGSSAPVEALQPTPLAGPRSCRLPPRSWARWASTRAPSPPRRSASRRRPDRLQSSVAISTWRPLRCRWFSCWWDASAEGRPRSDTSTA